MIYRVFNSLISNTLQVLKARKEKEKRQARQKGQHPGARSNRAIQLTKAPKTRSTKYGGEKGKNITPGLKQKLNIKKTKAGKGKQR